MMIRNIFRCKVLPLKINPGIRKGDHQELEQGFTLLEALVVVFIIGILSAIAAPSWVSMLNNTRVRKGQDAIALAITDAQRQARQKKISQQVTLLQNPATGKVQWAVYPPETTPSAWQNIEQNQLIIDPPSWTITFDDKGHTTDTGTMLVSIENGGAPRCVKVQTLLGTVRKAQGDACIAP